MSEFERTRNADSPRILMLLENNPYPGDTRVRREARALVDAGYRVTVIAPRDPDELPREQVAGVSVYRYSPPRSNTSVLGFAWEFIYSTWAALWVSFRVWGREGFDAVHAHNPPDTLFAVGLFYRLLGKPFVFDHHDVSPELYLARTGGQGNRLIYSALRFLERCTYWTANHVIATNESFKRLAMERGKRVEADVTIVRNGPLLKDIGAYEPYPDLVGSGKTILGYAGVIGIQDGLDCLVRALAHLLHDRKRDDFYCIVMGEGDDLPRVRELAERLGVSGHIRFTGWVQKAELGRYLTSIDIGLDPDPSNPCNDHCTMIKMSEYMAFAKPIVAFDLPEHRFTARDAAVYVPDNDEAGFAAAIERLMDDPAARSAMGAAGLERVKSELAWEFSAPRLVSVYDRLFHSLTYSRPLPSRTHSS
ncbi:MAG: glycosyltransferase family 4 protein [Rhodothermales bacterium]|nr:glycosyltransferase family 4 protein [Rhodothermales bacterium]